MNDKDLYQGFAPEKQAEYESYIADRFADGQALIEAGNARRRSMTKTDVTDMLARVDAIEAAMARALADGLPADSETVQSLILQHCDWIAGAWDRPPSREAYTGLGQLYLDHPDFRARYETRAPGLTEYLAEAMRRFAEERLS